MHGNRPKCTETDQNETKLTKSWMKWTQTDKMDQTGSKGTKTEQNRPKPTQMD